jgi:hypothetical protein
MGGLVYTVKALLNYVKCERAITSVVESVTSNQCSMENKQYDLLKMQFLTL